MSNMPYSKAIAGFLLLALAASVTLVSLALRPPSAEAVEVDGFCDGAAYALNDAEWNTQNLSVNLGGMVFLYPLAGAPIDPATLTNADYVAAIEAAFAEWGVDLYYEIVGPTPIDAFGSFTIDTVVEGASPLLVDIDGNVDIDHQADACLVDVPENTSEVAVIKTLTDGSVVPDQDFEFEITTPTAECVGLEPGNVFITGAGEIAIPVTYEADGVQCDWVVTEVNLPPGCGLVNTALQSSTIVTGPGAGQGGTDIVAVTYQLTVRNDCPAPIDMTISKQLADGSADPGVDFEFEIVSLVDPDRCSVDPASVSVAAGASQLVSVAGDSSIFILADCEFQITEVNLLAGCFVVGDNPVVVVGPAEAFDVEFVNFCAAPGLTIEKSTNDIDADIPAEGPTVSVGDAVTWTYTVTNTGNTHLTNVTVTDDIIADADISCDGGTNTVAGPIAPGAIITCTATGNAIEGDYANIGTATGTPSDDAGVALEGIDSPLVTDPSHYTGVVAPTPGLTIEKSTNDIDADTQAEGPMVTVGDQVTWTYTVTNTGNTHLTNVTVTDDIIADADISCEGGTNTVAGPIAPGAVIVCIATGTAAVGDYANVGTATGTPSDDAGVTLEGIDPPLITDPSHYTGTTDPVAGVTIAKTTNGVDADTQAEGPTISVGDAVTWTYTVTNTGNTHLTNVTVTDDIVADADISCDGGTNTVAGPIAPGAVIVCTATGTATVGDYANVGTATGTPSDDAGVTLVDVAAPTGVDPSHYTGTTDPVAGVTIAKATNGVDADTQAEGPTISVGGAVTWTYTVTNTGDTYLADVTVTDNAVMPADIDCGGGSNVIAGPIAPNAIVVCTATGTAIDGDYANIGSATGTPSDDAGVTLVDVAAPTGVDPSHYTGTDTPTSGVTIAKTTNGADADTQADGPMIAVGDTVTWMYTVTNTGNTYLADVTVTDDKVDSADIDCGNGSNTVAGPLAPSAIVTCTATGSAVEGNYANVGTATGSPSTETGEPLTDVPDPTGTDPSHYTGTVDPMPSLSIVKLTNGVDVATQADGPVLMVGDTVTWTYTVTNTGDTYLTAVTVTDNQVDPADIDCGNGSNVVAGPVAPGDAVTCTATGTAIDGDYANVGSATGSPSTETGDPLTDVSDPTGTDTSYYTGTNDPMPRVQMVKTTNNLNVDSLASSPVVTVGSAVTWTYTVTNTGNTHLTNVTVTDNQVAASDIDCGDGTNVVAGPIAPGAVVTCSASGVAVSGNYSNVGTASATPTDSAGTPNGQQPATGSDTSYYRGTTTTVVTTAVAYPYPSISQAAPVAQPAARPVARPSAPLAVTGTEAAALVAVGMTAIAAGGYIAVATRRREND